ncbi:MAG TPA: Crp/Fnr family transcriptional regulator [Gemmatimonadaceae bacterium]|nr:Crp/Fnr family transcriptional regulator [Gemmatimonadaceae bacterium]
MHGHADDIHTEHNRLLLALPRANYQRLLPALETVSLAQGRVLFDDHERISHVYFPQHSVVSLLTLVGDGPAVDVAIVGNEGIVGLDVFLGAHTATMRAVARIPDDARRMTVRAFRRALIDGAALRQLLSHYTQAVLGQIAQCAACNQRHSIEQRCARWLLMAHDRVGADHFLLTQDSLGHVLDVQRPTVSAAARHLQDAGAIQYSRGKIRITSRACLQSAACACYRMIDEDYARAFGSPPG